jgi:hypothetical protein
MGDMACADVATATAKTTAINLIIGFLSWLGMFLGYQQLLSITILGRQFRSWTP